MRTFVFTVALGTALSGCAHAPPPRELRVDDPLVVTPGPDAALAALDEAALFETGVAAFAAGDYARAAGIFERYVGQHPDGPRRLAAHFDAGLAWERLGEYLTALDHYAILLREAGGEDWLDAAFHAAECLYQLEDFRRAAELLRRVAEAEGLPAALRVEALVKEGVCLLEAGEADTAELRLRRALGHYRGPAGGDEPELDPFWEAQARFYLGEVFRGRFERAPFDPGRADLARLTEDLEHKAGLLLSAQNQYLRSIRLGEPRWATAAGYRVGRLYEILHAQMLEARSPAGLRTAGERVAYRELLHERIRILLEKALSAYRETLAVAERLGIEGPWRARVEAGFARVRDLLREADGAAVPRG